MTNPPPPPLPGPSPEPVGWYPAPPRTAPERVRAAWQARSESDYIFSFPTALGWTIITCGFYAVYVVYQLMRRAGDHNLRRIELLDGDLVKHDYAEGAIEHELSGIYGRLGVSLAPPDPGRLKSRHNYGVASRPRSARSASTRCGGSGT